MSSPALSTFLPILMIALAMIVWWRAVIAIVSAFLIAVLIIGVYEVVDRIDQHSVPQAVIGPLGGEDLPQVPPDGALPQPT